MAKAKVKSKENKNIKIYIDCHHPEIYDIHEYEIGVNGCIGICEHPNKITIHFDGGPIKTYSGFPYIHTDPIR